MKVEDSDFNFILYASFNCLDIAVDGMYLERKIQDISKKCMISILSCFSAALISQNIIAIILFLYSYNICIKISRNPYEEEKRKNREYIKYSILIWIIAIISIGIRNL